MKEIWKNIEYFEGYYQVSNFGRIKSLKRTVPARNHPKYKKRSVNERIIKCSITNKNCYLMHLCKGARKTAITVHRLVARAFIPNPQNKPWINHRDSNRLNNNINNLEWCTKSENAQYARKTANKTTSKYKGVSLNNKRNKWQAYIWINKKNKFLGLFKTQKEAALAYNHNAIKYFGNFSLINKIL